MTRGTLVAFDADDIIYPFVPTLNHWYNRTFGTNFKVRDYFSYNFSEIWRVSRREAEVRVAMFIDSQDYLNMQPYQETVRTIQTLVARGYVVPVITSRSDRIKEHTLASLARGGLQVPQVISAVHFSRNHYVGHGNHQRMKAEICKENGVRFIVDDSADYAQQCAREGIWVFLVRRKWNQHLSGGGRIMLIDSPEEILGRLR